MFNRYPNTDLQSQNIDWIINKVISMDNNLKNFTSTNKIVYAGEYDPNMSYKAWSVVKNGDFGYLALKDVPVGINLTNNEYWETIADFMSLYGWILDDLLNFKKHGVASSNRNILFITDSYGVFLHDETSNFPYLTASFLGCQYTLNGLPGSGFIGTVSKTFDTLMNEAPIDDYTDIVYVGGYNDRNVYANTLADAVNATIVNTAVKYPNANIWVINAGVAIAKNEITKLLTPAYAYNHGVKRSRARYANVAPSLMMRVLLASDGVHPGNNGMVNLALAISQVLREMNYNVVQPLTSANIVRLDGNAHGGVVFGTNNGYSKMLINYDSVQFTNKITLTCDGSHPIKLGTINNTSVVGGNFTDHIHGNLHARGDLEQSVAHFYNISGDFYLEGLDLYFNPRQIRDNANGYGGTEWLTLTNVDYVAINPITFSCYSGVQ